MGNTEHQKKRFSDAYKQFLRTSQKVHKIKYKDIRRKVRTDSDIDKVCVAHIHVLQLLVHHQRASDCWLLDRPSRGSTTWKHSTSYTNRRLHHFQHVADTDFVQKPAASAFQTALNNSRGHSFNAFTTSSKQLLHWKWLTELLSLLLLKKLINDGYTWRRNGL